MRRLFDVYTQIHLAEQSGQLSGPGYDINELKKAGLVVPDSSSPIGVKPSVPAIQRIPTGPTDTGTKVSFSEARPKVEVPTGVLHGEIEEQQAKPTGITLSLSDAERRHLTTLQEQAACPADAKKYTARVYKVYLTDTRDHILVEAHNKESARQRATEAGYDVKGVTWSPSYGETKAPTTIGIDKYTDSRGNYDLIGIANAYRTKDLTGDQLEAAFGSKGAHEVSVISDVLKKLEPYKTGDGYLLSAALADRAVTQYEVGKIFSQQTVTNAVANRQAAATLSNYKDSDGNYDFIAISEALGRGNIKDDTISSVFGAEAVNEAQSVATILKKLEPYKTQDGYLVTDAIQKGAVTEAEAARIFSPDTIAQARGWIALTKAPSAEEWGAGAPISVATKTTQMQKPGAAMPWKEAGLIAAEVVVPYLYVARHWDSLPTWEKALWITLDTVLFIIPMASAGMRGARTVGVAAAEAGRLARVSAAAKNIGREAWIMIKAPVETIIHPVAATKQAAKDTRALVENLFRGKKIPEAVISTTEGTVRLSLTKATSVDDYMRARDALMKAAAQGDTPLVALKDAKGKTIATLQLQEAPLMREVKGGVVHSTPWGEKFRAGLTVEGMANMPLAEQGLFVSHEPLPRFATQSAFNLPVDIGQQGRGVQTITTRFGANQVANIHLQKQLSQETVEALAKARLVQVGDDLIQPLSTRQVNKLVETLRTSGNAQLAAALEDTVSSYKPIFRIMDPDKAKEIIASGKTYRGAVEIEARLPVGTKIAPPKQILVTRIGPQSTEVQIWLDKALSARQIAKLKAEGLVELFRQPFRFPLKIKGKVGTLSPAQVDDLARLVRAGGNPEVARNLDRAYRLTQSARRMANIAAKAAAVAVTRSPERVEAIRRAEGIQVIRGVEWLERRDPLQRIERTRSGRIITREARVSRTRREVRVERVARARQPTRVARAERERLEREAERTRVPREERVERPIRGERPVRPIRPIRTVRPVRPVRPIRPTRLTKPRDLQPIKGKQKKIHEGPALAVWKQGRYWVSIFPPFRTTGKKEDVVYSLRRPTWGGVIAHGRHSPRVTLRSIGKVPEVITVPMGVVTATIKGGRHLTFSRRNGRKRGRVILG